MKKILLATTLLSIAMSEHILMENYLRPKTVWVRDKKFGNKKIKRASNEISSDVEEFSNYDDDTQVPRISETRFSNTRKLPSLTFMRPSDLTLLPQVKLLSSDKPKLDSAKPTVLISIDIQEGKNVNDDLQKDCSTIKNHHKHNHGWQIQQPFFVEEPRWINIYSDVDDSSRRLYKYDDDPYILSRGKKIVKIKDTEQVEKTIPNKYSNRNERFSMKNRIRRSVVINENSWNHTMDDNKKKQKKEINHYHFFQVKDSNNITMTKRHRNITMDKNEDRKSYKINKIFEDEKSEENTTSSVHNVFIKKYQRDKITNVTEKLPYEFKSMKRRIFANDEKIINIAEQKREDVFNRVENEKSKIAKISRDKKFNNRKSFLNYTNKRNKRSVLLKNKNFSDVYAHNKYKVQNIDTSLEKNVERNKTDVYENMKNKTYIDKLADLNIHNDDTFILSSKKLRLDNEAKSSNKTDIDHKKFIEKPWKIQYYMRRKKLESKEGLRNEKNKPEIYKDDIEATDVQLTNKFDSESSGIRNYFNRRKRRSACEACRIKPQSQDRWLKDIERKIQDSLSLERRNKHSDILKDLSLYEPYVISRGKKASRQFEGNIYSTKLRNVGDTDRITTISFPLAKALLKMLLIEISRCNICHINANSLSNKRSQRDRRGVLDEILTVYDPYYVARGKRINLDKFLSKMRSLRSQKSVSFEINGKQ